MKIDGTGTAATTRRTDKAKGARRPGGFSGMIGTGASQETGAATGMTGPAAVMGLLGLQEEDSHESPGQRGQRRAHAILDRLEELRMDILAGQVPERRLRAIAGAVAADRAAVDDPALAAVLDEVDLRAQVELAKLEMAAGRS